MLDTFQRYVAAYQIVERLADQTDGPVIRLLDVGSNGPGFASYNQFANVSQTNIDIVEVPQSSVKQYPQIEFLIYSGEILPFPDGSFDIVICADVLEHVPPAKRKAFIREVVRISRQQIIFVFPIKTSEKWEKILSTFTLGKIKFLQEHILYGLPDEQDFLKVINGMNDVRLACLTGNMNIWIWIPLKLLSSVIYRIIRNDSEAIKKCFLLFKVTLSKWINWGQCYSKTFVLEKI